MRARRLLATTTALTATALAAAVTLAGTGVANAEGSVEQLEGSVEQLAYIGSGVGAISVDILSGDFQSIGLSNIAVSISYECKTTGDTGDENSWRSSAHVITTVTNTGMGNAANVDVTTSIPGMFSATEHIARLFSRQTVVFDHDTKATALTLVPVFATIHFNGRDANRFNNAAVSIAPGVCGAL